MLISDSAFILWCIGANVFSISVVETSQGLAMAFQILPQWVSAPNTLTVTTVLVLCVTLIAIAWLKRRKFVERVNKVPGSGTGGYTILGDANDVTFIFKYLNSVLMSFNYHLRF